VCVYVSGAVSVLIKHKEVHSGVPGTIYEYSAAVCVLKIYEVRRANQHEKSGVCVCDIYIQYV